MDRLTVLCFAGTYGLALVAALARLALRPQGRWLPTAALIALGLAVHVAYLANRAIKLGTLPMATSFESLLVLGGVLAAVALYLEARAVRERPTLAGPAVLALAIAVLTVAGRWAPRAGTSADWQNALTFWGAAHGLFLTLGAVCTCLGFAFGLMYLAQARRLKRKRPTSRGLPLPSLEQSERWHRAAILIAFPLLTAGIATGIGLVLATRHDGAARLSWNDPKIASTLALWLVFAALLHARYRPDWQGRRVMILTVVAFAFLAFAMIGVGMILPTRHKGLAALDAHAAGRAP
jgi:ABC-type uncharacterized transport system permease subunit